MSADTRGWTPAEVFKDVALAADVAWAGGATTGTYYNVSGMVITLPVSGKWLLKVQRLYTCTGSGTVGMILLFGGGLTVGNTSGEAIGPGTALQTISFYTSASGGYLDLRSLTATNACFTQEVVIDVTAPGTLQVQLSQATNVAPVMLKNAFIIARRIG